MGHFLVQPRGQQCVKHFSVVSFHLYLGCPPKIAKNFLALLLTDGYELGFPDW
jgi:hypothetical protein